MLDSIIAIAVSCIYSVLNVSHNNEKIIVIDILSNNNHNRMISLYFLCKNVKKKKDKTAFFQIEVWVSLVACAC